MSPKAPPGWNLRDPTLCHEGQSEGPKLYVRDPSVKVTWSEDRRLSETAGYLSRWNLIGIRPGALCGHKSLMRREEPRRGRGRGREKTSEGRARNLPGL